MGHGESHLISLAYRIPFRIGIFFIEMLMCIIM